MNLEDIRIAYNRIEPGQSPGERRTNIFLMVLGGLALAGCIYYIWTESRMKIKPEKKLNDEA